MVASTLLPSALGRDAVDVFRLYARLSREYRPGEPSFREFVLNKRLRKLMPAFVANVLADRPYRLALRALLYRWRACLTLLFVAANLVIRPVMEGIPRDVQDEANLLVRRNPHPAAQHLHKQTSARGGSEHCEQVHSRIVKPCGECGDSAENLQYPTVN